MLGRFSIAELLSPALTWVLQSLDPSPDGIRGQQNLRSVVKMFLALKMGEN